MATRHHWRTSWFMLAVCAVILVALAFSLPKIGGAERVRDRTDKICHEAGCGK